VATLVLQAAGAAVGSLFGPLGTIVGRALGGLAGNAVDQMLFGERRTVEGPRLADLSVQTSREGSAIPRVYGRVRISGQVIWATRFEETVSDASEGGKGGGGSGTTVRTYSYFANFAVGLCEGPIARIGRVWADGKPLDLSTLTYRLYRGDGTQDVDSLIEAKQGDAPAYRDTAVVVFERLALEDFGNRIPQLSFEVIRPVPGIEDAVRAVTMVPGSTEFGYDPEPVSATIAPGSQATLNRHVDGAATDWQASLDELQAVCANVDRVGLVTAWFGDDVRASACTLKPGVADRTTVTTPYAWSAGGLDRATARLVSTFEGKAAFGGTPSDASIVRAIRDLADRDVKVTFYPFIMMDVPHGNGLDDPYGGAEQAAYPWRGSITLSVAPGLPGSPDKTTAAAGEVAAFVGTAAVDDFALDGDHVVYSGPDEWSFRRFILHYAWLCKAAGGVDAFLISSELRGLTTIRSGAATYPFVAALVALADDVREILGGGTTITYGADWSEYFGHHPDDGSGDVFFHLDPLWASDAIDCVGIDNYMPLLDWRDGGDHLDAADWDSGRDVAYLRANIAAGEGYDWYYASDADRAAQVRTPITDGGGKPWVFRYKDLVSWWGNDHYNRPAGVESGTHTAWVPQSKPIWFTEAGCPAIDKGPNQPNVFFDPKSSASALPYFSNGLRDDLVQRRYIEATLGYWTPDDPDFDPAANPESTEYDGRMVDVAAIHWWTWDARPYPAFPLMTEVWSDGANWERGHWLTGRFGALTADALVAAVLADYGATATDVGDLDGMVDGFMIGDVTSARGALEPLAQLLSFEAYESGDAFAVVRRGRRARETFTADDLVEEKDKPIISVRRAEETELPAEIGIGFADPLADYRPTSVSSRRLVGGSRRAVTSETGAVLSYAVASGLADMILQDMWAGREAISFALPQRSLALEPADICTLEIDGDARTILVTRIEDAGLRRVEARTIEPDILAPVPVAARTLTPAPVPSASRPEIMLLDLPLLTGSEPGYAPRVAAFASPWPGAIALAIGSSDTGYVARQVIDRRAVMGELTAPLGAGPVARWDWANSISVRLYGGALAGEPETAVLNGANAAAIGTSENGFEVVQFETATLTGPGTWLLSGLLRGQAGTADFAALGHEAGARFVLLDRAVVPLALSEAESGLGLTLRAGAAGAAYDPATFNDVPIIPARRGLRCLAPVHARAARDADSGDVAISWTRQTRIGGDAWEPVEVPLGETIEAYAVAILDGVSVLRTLSAATPSVTYTAAQQVADFGSLPSDISVSISQVSPTEGPGLALTGTLHA
jgi:hypothetical protein